MRHLPTMPRNITIIALFLGHGRGYVDYCDPDTNQPVMFGRYQDAERYILEHDLPANASPVDVLMDDEPGPRPKPPPGSNGKLTS